MVQLNDEWDQFHIIKQKVLRELIIELEGIQIPPDWRPREVLGFVIRKLEDKEKAC